VLSAITWRCANGFTYASGAGARVHAHAHATHAIANGLRIARS
jgi:hypothetical protein